MFSSQRRHPICSRAQQSRRRFRQGLLEKLEPRLVMDSQWQNPARPLDVNNDGVVAPLDALLIINKLNTSSTTELPPRTNPLDLFYDTTGDGRLSPIDALLVINQLNTGTGTSDPRVPGETETGPAGFLSMPLTTLSGVAGQVVRLKADLTIGQREFNEMGVFVVDNASGSINGVMPTSIDYARQAFTVAQRRVLFSRRDEFKLSTTVDLPAGQHLRVYVLQSANSSDGDPAKHIRVRISDNGARRVAWEEFLTTGGLPTVGDRGFDDAFVDMQFDAPLNINSAPVLTSLPDRSLPELTTLTFNVTAFDADLPVDQILYTLDSAPTGATLNSSTGEFSWTPTEGQGPGTFTVIVRATDRSGAFDTEAINVEVQEVNLAPSLAVLPDVDLRPGNSWQASASSSDPDLPTNSLIYALAAGAPVGMTIDSGTGLMRFTAPSTDRQSVYPVTVIVRDNGIPSLSSSRSFNIRVTAQRTAPVLEALPNVSIPEMVERTIAITACDLDLPDDTLRFTLVSGPTGATLDQATGLFRWTPTEAQGPGPYPVTVSVTDRDGRSDSKSFTITVSEVNRPPVLEPLTSVRLTPGQSFSLAARASDPDVPLNTLTYSISGNAPPGFTFNTSTGQFNWTAPANATPTQYSFLVQVSDNGSPNLSDSKPVSITVDSPIIEMIEDERFVTQTTLPVTIGADTSQLQFVYDDLIFDRQDSDSVNDAFELALVDSSGRPLVGIINPDRDGFFNRSEEFAAQLANGVAFTSDSDGNGGTVRWDVSHLIAGTSANLIVRLVNNDADNTTRVRFNPRLEQIVGVRNVVNLITPPAWARTLNVLDRVYDDTDWRHLADVTSALATSYEFTAYDIDTRRVGASVVLHNTSDYPIRGPLLVTGSGITAVDARFVNTAGMLPRDVGRFSDAAVARLAGAEFLDATGSLAHADLGGALLPGETVRLLLEFENASNARFDYQLNVLGFLNAAPKFDTQAPTSVRLGNSYRYDSNASDPDLDRLTYALTSAPGGLVVDAATGLVTWTPKESDLGTHFVELRTVDPFGATDIQRFTIEVVAGNALNRPPAFVTDPVVEAVAGVPYTYSSRASDPDFDSLTYAMIAGPIGMSILAGPSQANDLADTAGNVSWTPSAALAGTFVPVTLQVEDGRGGQALQNYRVYVRPSATNSPPIIVSTPQIDFDWAGPLGVASGPVSPAVIELDLAGGDKADKTVKLTVPPQLPMVDVFLLFDDTGSFGNKAPQLASAFPQVIDRLRAAMPQVDFGFGVGRFEEYAGEMGATDEDRPFTLNQPILPVAYPGMRQAIERALSREAPGDGGDIPETLIEGLYQVATGVGFDGDADGSLTESGLAGLIRGQLMPGNSGDVPRFIPLVVESYRRVATALPLNADLPVPAISSTSNIAFKFNVQPGDVFGFADTSAPSDVGQWLIVNPLGQVLAAHKRGQPFMASFDKAEEILLVPRTSVGSVAASTLRRTTQSAIAAPLVFNEDIQFAAQTSGQPRRYTFTIDQATPVFFDSIRAVEGTSWRLRDDSGTVFASHMLEFVRSSEQVNPTPAGLSTYQSSTADQFKVLEPGSYTLELAAPANETTIFRAAKFPLVPNSVATIGTATTVAITKEKMHWVRLDGSTGQSINVSPPPKWILDADGVVQPQLPNPTRAPHIPRYGTLTFGSKPTYWIGYTGDRDLTTDMIAHSVQPPTALPAATAVTLGSRVTGQLTPSTSQLDYEFRLDSWQWVTVAGNQNNLQWRLQSAGGAGWVEQDSTMPGRIPFLNQAILLAPGRHRLSVQQMFIPRTVDFAFTLNAQPYAGSAYITDTVVSEYAPFGPGSRGGAGFRSGAVPIILAATDAGTVYQSQVQDTDFFRGANGIQLPIGDLTSGARNTTPGGRGAGIQPTIDALVAQGALVIGLGSTEDPSQAPRRTLEALSKLTGAINGTTTTLTGNLQNDPIAPGDPFYFVIGDDSTTLVTSVADAIEAAVKATPSNIDLQATDATAGFTNLTGKFLGVRPGTELSFDTRFIGDGRARVFDLQFTRSGTSEKVGSIPVAINDRYRYDSRAIDPDNDPVQLELVGQTHGANLDATTGKIRWRPSAPGSYTFTLRASDPFGGEDRQSWTVVVGDVRATNSAPVLSPLAPVTVTSGAALRVQASATDSDKGDQLTYTFLGPSVGGNAIPVGLTIDSSTGQIDWSPSVTQIGQSRVIVRATDARGGFDDEPLIIEVVPPAASDNRTPNIATNPIGMAVVHRSYLYDVDADDLDHDPLNYSLVLSPRGMVIDSATGAIGWKPTVVNLGVHDVLIKVSDGRGGVAFQSYQLLVGQANDPPEIISRPSGAAAPGSAWKYNAVATDPNGDALRYSLVTGQNPVGASIDAGTGLVGWTPTTTGAYRFVIEVSDGRGGRARQEFTLPVSDSAPPAIVSQPTGPARVGERYEYLVVATDPNTNDAVSLSLDAISIARGAILSAVGCPAETTGCAAAARLVWTPNSIGDFPITLTATDRDGNTATQNFTLTVVAPSSPSQPPRITSRPTGPAIKDQAWTYSVTAIDPDGDVVTYRLGQAPAGMTIDRATGLARWTPTAISSGTSVEVVAEDARGAWSIQAFDLPVIQRSSNAAPIFTSIPTGPAQVGQSWSYQASAFDPDGDTVTYSLDAAALTAGFSIDRDSGLITWTPTTSGEQPLTVTAQDAYGGRSSQIITLAVNPKPNLPPQFVSIPSGPASVGRAWTYVARASDPEGDALRYSLAASTPTSVAIDALTGRITYTPTSVGSIELTVIATDIVGNRAEQQFNLPAVTNSGAGNNRPPVFTSEPIGPARIDQEWAYMALALDADGDAITYALDSASLAAGLTIETSTGRVAWTPRSLGNRTIEVQVRDAAGNVTAQRFELPVVRDNRPPVIESQPSGPVLVGRPWSYSVVASDPDGEPVSLSLDAASLARGVTLANNQVRWTPTATGNQTIIVTASDGRGGQATQTIQLTVGPASTASGNAPRFRSLPPKETALGQPLNYRADAFDPDGTSIRYQLTRGVAGMSIDSESGLLSWRPEQLGHVSVEITAIDDAGEMTVQAFTLGVVPASGGNAAPIITSTPRGPAVRDLLYRYPVVASDPNGDALTYTIDAQSQSRGFTITAGGLMQWLPTAAGDYPITVTVRDVHGAVAEQSFTLAVISNAPPQITSTAPQRLELGQTLNYTVTALDPNAGDTITYSIDSLAGASMNAQSGLLTWRPTTAGRYNFSVFATDSQQARDEQTIELLVVDPANNRPPTIDGSPRSSIALGVEYLWQVPATDPDGDALTFQLVNGPAGLTVDASGLLRWKPDAAQVTSGDNRHTLTVRANDGRGGSDTKTWRMAVTHSAGNQSPVIARVQVRAVDYDLGGDVPTVIQHAVANRVYQALFTAVDPEGDTLVWSLVDAPVEMRIDTRGLVDYRPTASDVGAKDVQVRVTDAAGASGLFTYKLTVRAGNTPARISGNPPAQHKVSTLYSTTFTATDIDNDPVTFRFVAGQPSHGAVLDASSGKLTWTPATTGTYRFFVAAVDPLGEGTQLVFDVLVDQFGANAPPRFDEQQPGVAEVGVRYSRRFSAVDPDGDVLTYAIEEGPAGMTIVASDGTVTWDAPAAAIGTSPLVKLTARDTAGQTARYQFRLPVRAANTAPRFDSTPLLFVTAGNIYRTDVSVSDVDGDPLTLKLLNGPSGLTLDESTGRVSWTTAISNLGTHAVKVSVTDGRIAQPLEQNWTITVAADSTKPQIKLFASSAVIDIGTEVSFEVRATDNVAVAERTLKVGTTNIALSSSGFGKFIFTSAGRFNAAATASDAAGNLSTDQLSILVRDPNNAAPQLLIGSPTTGQQLTAPTDVALSVTDTERDLTSVRLLFASADGSADFRQFAALTAPAGQKLENFTNKVIGKFDPTNLANGSYIIRAVAEDAGFNQTTRETTVQVAGRLKLGNFAVSFDDLTIPVSGIPITIVRKYDTLDAGQRGDFGYGWSLEVRQVQVRIDHSTLGGIGSGRYRAFVDGTRVFITTPEGTEEGYTFYGVPDQTLFGIPISWKSFFLADAGNVYRLEAPAGGLTKLGDEYLSGYGTTYNPQDPEFGNTFEISTYPKHLQYNVNATTGQTHSIETRNGNRLELRPDGIYSNLGRSVQLQRDMLGRIVSITDPLGNSLTYQYDAQGRLIKFYDRRATARLRDNDPSNDFAPTIFEYSLLEQFPEFLNSSIPGVENFLTKVVDPLGNDTVRAVYASDGRLASLSGPTGSTVTFGVDVTSLSESLTSPTGGVQTTQYDKRGNVVEKVNADGLKVRTEYDASNRAIRSVTIIGEPDKLNGESNDRITTTSYANNGSYSTTDEMGHTTRYVTSSSGQGVTVVDPHGNSTTIAVDNTGALLSAQGATGGGVAYEHDRFGNLTRVSRPGQGSQGDNVAANSFEFNGFGDVVAAKSVSGVVSNLAYDANGQATKYVYTWTNPTNNSDTRNIETLSSYDPEGNVVRVEANGNVAEYEYDALGRQTTAKANGVATSTTYDIVGNAVQVMSADGRVVRTVYDAIGRAQWRSEPHFPGVPTYATKLEYDHSNRVISESRFESVIFTLVPAGKGQFSIVVSGGITSPQWTERTEYNQDGTVSQTRSRTGLRTTYLYDHSGRNIGTTQYVGDSTYSWTYQLDANDEKVSETDPNGNTTLFKYDSAGRLVETVFADRTRTSITYDDRGAIAAKTDQSGQTVLYSYDSAGNLLSIQQPAVLDPISQQAKPVIYQYQYDAYGNRTAITDAYGRVTSFTFNPAGQELSSTRPSIPGQPQSVRKSFYRADGKLDYEASFDGRITQYIYDTRGQVSTQSYYASDAKFRENAPAATTMFTYGVQTQNGRKDIVSDERGTTEYFYDDLNRLYAIVTPDGVVRYEYDPYTDQPSRVYTDQTEIRYQYDTRSLLVLVSSVKEFGQTLAVPRNTQYTYNAVGQVATQLLPNGIRTTTQYDALNRVVYTLHSDSSGALLDSYYYQRDVEGKVLAVYNDLSRSTVEAAIATNQAQQLSRDLYTYDILDRLKAEVHYNAGQAPAQYQVDYVWDLVGNLKEKTVTKGNTIERSSFVYNNRDELVDEVFALNGTTQWVGDFDYDPQGNLVRSKRGDTTIEYEFDVRNRLARASNTTAGVITTVKYQYDRDGLQVGRQEISGSLSVTEALVRDPLSPYGHSRVIEKRSSSGNLLTSYIQGLEPIAEVTPSTVFYLLEDSHSGVRVIVDASNNAMQHVAYDSFGSLITTAPTISSEHLYRTESLDRVSGQYYLRARYYTPLSTTFSQLDPYAGDVDNPISLHRFQFADRDPLQHHDPTGQFTATVSIGTIAIAGGQLAVAHHDVQQGDRAAALHFANIMSQVYIFNLMTSFAEEHILAGHVVLGSALWQAYLRPKMYESAARLNFTPKRLLQLATLAAAQAAGNAILHLTGVPIKISGHPNFTHLLYKSASYGITPWQSSVFMLYTGFRSYRGNPLTNDILRANTAMTFLAPTYPLAYAHHPRGINGQPSGYTWHHHEVVGIMMLVKQRLGHAFVKHTGGVFYWSFIHGVTKYGS